MALLTATVKLFIKRPTAGQELVPKVLKWATEEVDNPDLRDRGFIYWRLLSTDPGAASSIVFADKPPISTETEAMDRGVLDRLLLHTGTLASLYGKEPQTFVRGAKPKFLNDSAALDPLAKQSAMNSTMAYSMANANANAGIASKGSAGAAVATPGGGRAPAVPPRPTVDEDEYSPVSTRRGLGRQESTGESMGASSALMAQDLLLLGHDRDGDEDDDQEEEEEEAVALNPTGDAPAPSPGLAQFSAPVVDEALDPYASLARMSLDFGGAAGGSGNAGSGSGGNGYGYEGQQPVLRGVGNSRGDESLL